ncbi:SGNH/GDSL hydrolase family protein [Allosphingosinicella deserti]|uniref:SGNH/GDSL hydrolase family protein n=1 Tax=Allosphingosinicella deserti TaxID=2116704 RepID=UPI0018EBFE38|nr:SGNH/GDSL hydrolase family protein [Sphingomonas deserti]
MRRKAILLAAFLLSSAACGQAQTEPSAEQRARWAREAEERTHSDWAYLARYLDANAALTADAGQQRIVFLGDSITEGWVSKMPGFFTPGRVGRGISGQTTPQMLVRMRQDVIALKPRVLHIMAGTNDVAGNTGATTDEQIQDNIRSMTELAQAHGIRVILASIPPAADFPWKPGLNPGVRIERLNRWIQAYAKRAGAVYADYWSATRSGLGFRDGLAYDGVHPTEAGYAAMAPVAEAALRQALALPSPGTAVRCASAANPC